MTSYETTATVESRGEIHVSGVPFQPGTSVKITISPAQNGADSAARTARLLAALDKARNTQPVGPLDRAALYDRDILR